MNGMYEELLEKLRKNNRMSGWTHIDRLIDEAAEAIESLQAENKQLRAQLDEWKYEVKCHMDEVIARGKQIEQLITVKCKICGKVFEISRNEARWYSNVVGYPLPKRCAECRKNKKRKERERGC